MRWLKRAEVRTWKTLTEEEKLNVEISENEVRKEFSKAERVEYGRRLERIEREKAKERQGTRTDLTSEKIFPEVTRPNDVVAEKLGIGSGKQYEKEKTIVDNRDLISAEGFADWDEGKLSTNKAYQQIKAELNRQKAENERLRNRPPETKIKSRQRGGINADGLRKVSSKILFMATNFTCVLYHKSTTKTNTLCS